MTKAEFEEYNDIEPGTIILEPWETFSKGIVDCTVDKCHVIYSYEKLAEAMREEDGELGMEFIYDELNYNTLGNLENMDAEQRPIIMLEVL